MDGKRVKKDDEIQIVDENGMVLHWWTEAEARDIYSALGQVLNVSALLADTFRDGWGDWWVQQPSGDWRQLTHNAIPGDLPLMYDVSQEPYNSIEAIKDIYGSWED